AGMVTTPQASRHATDRIVAPPYRALDAGLRPGPFPDRAASLLPGLLAATRTGLPPAGDDELTNTKIHHGTTSRLHLPPSWAHITGHYLMVVSVGRGLPNRKQFRIGHGVGGASKNSQHRPGTAPRIRADRQA